MIVGTYNNKPCTMKLRKSSKFIIAEYTELHAHTGVYSMQQNIKHTKLVLQVCIQILCCKQVVTD